MVLEQSLSIPVEKGVPLLGVLPKFFTGAPYDYLKNTMLRQGDLVQLNFGWRPIYLVSNPDYIQRILRDNYQNYRKPEFFYNSLKEVAQNGLVTSSGNFWMRQKRMIQPHLHRKQLAKLFSEMVEAISETLNDWEAMAQDGREVQLGEQMGSITINVITRTMFGKDLLSLEQARQARLHLAGIVGYVGEKLYNTMVPKWVPLPGRRQFERDLAELKTIVNQIIAKSRQEKASAASLIQMLIDSVDEETNEQMTEQQLFDEVITIFTAGFETTATALTWFAIVLNEHPELVEKLRVESDQVLAGRTPSFEDVARLTYIRQVFMETLRMYTIAPFLPRQLKEPDQLGDYHLPANALILIFYHGVHHDPKLWDQPETFDPERFSPEQIAKRHPFAYMPFSAGPRKCAGDEFAMLEGPLAMAMILQKYNLHILPNQTFTPQIAATMRPGKGVRATLSIR